MSRKKKLIYHEIQFDGYMPLIINIVKHKKYFQGQQMVKEEADITVQYVTVQCDIYYIQY